MSVFCVVVVEMMNVCRNMNHKMENIFRNCQPNNQKNKKYVFQQFQVANVGFCLLV